LNISLPPKPIYLQADAVRLAQVVANLLNNAAKYTPANGDITLSVDGTPAEIVISVSDNGVGIPARAAAQDFRHVHAGRPQPQYRTRVVWGSD
jgi:signal transduction histidine kinase